MHLLIDGQTRSFQPIKAFRAQYDLPPEFGVKLFEPKDYTGLGSIERAGTELNQVRTAVLASTPRGLSPSAWLGALPALQSQFRAELHRINPVVKLHEVEIDFAAAGFGDMTQAFVYALLRARAAGDPPPPYEAVYGAWLNSTVRVSGLVHHYRYRTYDWAIQIVNHAYGRAGLIVSMADEQHYVHDPALGCPAEGFMWSLLAEITAIIGGEAG
jgi:hypothetical protein